MDSDGLSHRPNPAERQVETYLERETNGRGERFYDRGLLLPTSCLQ